jgi:hypothetical protein
MRFLAEAARGSFDLMLAESMSRVGRDQEDRAAIRNRLGFHGMRGHAFGRRHPRRNRQPTAGRLEAPHPAACARGVHSRLAARAAAAHCFAVQGHNRQAQPARSLVSPAHLGCPQHGE